MTTMMMDLPECIVFEIFKRLPVRTLLRLRSVCKDWFSQINNPVFKQKHLAYHIARDDESLILVNMRYECYSGYITCYDDYESLLARGLKASSYSIYTGTSCLEHVNGIVCLEDGDQTIYLLNPALREIKQLPDAFSVAHPKSVPEALSDDHHYYLLKAAGFVSNCKYHRQAVGFGYDDCTKDYIVVQIISVFYRPKLTDDDYSPGPGLSDNKCVVYHVMTDSWTMVEMPEFMTLASSYGFSSYGFFPNSFFSHGSIHWLIYRDEYDRDDSRDPRLYRILTFNVANNKLIQEIEFPHGWNDYYEIPVYPHLFKVDNSCIALVVGFAEQGLVDVWVMKEYGVTESWTKQYSINSIYYAEPLCFLKADKLLLLTMERDADTSRAFKKKMVCYDLSKGELAYQPAEDVWYEHSSEPEEVVTCYESLISINKSSRLEKISRRIATI